MGHSPVPTRRAPRARHRLSRIYTTMMKLRAFVARILVRSQNASELATFNLQPATASAFPLGVAALARCASLCLFVAIPASFLCGLCDLCVRLFPSFLFGCGFAAL